MDQKRSPVARFFSRTSKPVFLVTAVLLILATFSSGQALIVDHTCTNITGIPVSWITRAKSAYRIAYGHTSHGSQIISGMEVLMSQDGLYSFNADGSGGALSLWDRVPEGDLGNPDRAEWYYRTRDLLDDPGCDRNLVL